MTVATKPAIKKPSTKKATTAGAKAAGAKTAVTKTAVAGKRVSKPKAIRAKPISTDGPDSATIRAPKGAKRLRKTSPVEQNETQVHARLAAKYAIEKKGENIRILDLRQVTTMTDFFVVVSADSDKQVKAIAENVIGEMRDTEGVAPWHSEGWDTLTWVIIDFVDFVVHVFQKEARVHYNLERLWADAPAEDIKDEPIKKVTRAKRTKKAEVLDVESEPLIRVIR